MRIAIIFLLLIVICATSYSPRKSSDKRKSSPKEENSPSKTVDKDSDEDEPIMDFSEEEEDAGVSDRKSKKKRKGKTPTESKKEKKENADDDEDIHKMSSYDFFEIVKQHHIQRLKNELESVPANNTIKLKQLQDEIDEEEEPDYDDNQYEACNGDPNGKFSDGELCHCDMHEIDCSSTILDSDNPHLRTANLKIMKETFVVYFANFSDNGIERLLENKILPDFEKTISVADFSHNGIRYIDGNAFTTFKNLTKLNLGSNNLQQIKKKWLKPLGKTLHRLDLGYNKLKSLSDGVFDDCKNLKTLILDGNPIRELKKEYFKGLDNLEELSLDDCKIENLPGDIFEYLPKLTGVSLRSNPIDEIPRAISNTAKLTELDLSDTNIAEIHENAFAGDVVLEEIFMEKMKYLSVVRECAFCGLTKLKTLTLSENPKLVEIHPNAFGFMKSDPGKKAASVSELNLFNSNISTLSEYMLDYDKLEIFRIGGNPWNCSCDTVFLMDSKTFTYKQDRSFPKCENPPGMKNKNLATLHGYEVCDSIRSSHRSNRTTSVLVISLLVCFVAIAAYHCVTTGKLSRMMRRVQNVPEVTYSNLTGAEENLNLETDFQPRPAVV